MTTLVYKCSICDQIYESESAAKACEKSHNTIYVEFTREELFKLIQFIYTKDDSLLQGGLIRKLLKYKRGTYV